MLESILRHFLTKTVKDCVDSTYLKIRWTPRALHTVSVFLSAFLTMHIAQLQVMHALERHDQTSEPLSISTSQGLWSLFPIAYRYPCCHPQPIVSYTEGGSSRNGKKISDHGKNMTPGSHSSRGTQWVVVSISLLSASVKISLAVLVKLP